MAIGWLVDIAEANTFYEKRAGVVSLWSGLDEDTEKVPALTTAYNHILRSSEVSIPDSPTVAELVILKYAQLEYALDFVISEDGQVRRRAVIAQGVTDAGLIKEKYKVGRIGLPDYVLDILMDFKTEKAGYVTEIYRDETENEAWDEHYDESS